MCTQLGAEVPHWARPKFARPRYAQMFELTSGMILLEEVLGALTPERQPTCTNGICYRPRSKEEIRANPILLANLGRIRSVLAANSGLALTRESDGVAMLLVDTTKLTVADVIALDRDCGMLDIGPHLVALLRFIPRGWCELTLDRDLLGPRTVVHSRLSSPCARRGAAQWSVP